MPLWLRTSAISAVVEPASTVVVTSPPVALSSSGRRRVTTTASGSVGSGGWAYSLVEGAGSYAPPSVAGGGATSGRGAAAGSTGEETPGVRAARLAEAAAARRVRTQAAPVPARREGRAAARAEALAPPVGRPRAPNGRTRRTARRSRRRPVLVAALQAGACHLGPPPVLLAAFTRNLYVTLTGLTCSIKRDTAPSSCSSSGASQ